MMIIDVIREASDEHEIYFLLTAYIEAVRYCDKLNNLPEHMWHLPLAGGIDLETRVDKLNTELAGPPQNLADKDRLIIREAVNIFDAALHRLRALQDEKSRQSQYVENAASDLHIGIHQIAHSQVARGEARRHLATVSNAEFAPWLSDSPPPP